MKVTLHDPADLQTLRERVRSETDAKQRDRLRAVLLAAEGQDGEELEGDRIAARLGRSPRFVDQWLPPRIGYVSLEAGDDVDVGVHDGLRHSPPLAPLLRRHFWLGIPEHHHKCWAGTLAARRNRRTDGLLTGAAIARMMGVGDSTIGRWRKSGKLPEPVKRERGKNLWTRERIEILQKQSPAALVLKQANPLPS